MRLTAAPASQSFSRHCGRVLAVLCMLGLACGQSPSGDEVAWLQSLPAAPSNVSISVEEGMLGLYFDDNSEDETGFEIQHKAADAPDESFVTLGVLPAAAGRARGHGTLIAGREGGAARAYRLRTLREAGPHVTASSFTPVSIAVVGMFDAPSGLQATAPASDGRVQLFWCDNATMETGYEVAYRQGTGDAFTPLGVISSSNRARYQTDGGVGGFEPGATVQFQIRAVQGSAERTAWSEIATVMIPPALEAPTGLIANARDEGSIQLEWADNTSNESGFVIQARLLPEGAWFDAEVLINTSEADRSATRRSRILNVRGTPLHPGATCEFRVRAVYESLPGFQIVSPEPVDAVSCVLPFRAPTGLVAGAATDREIHLRWTDHSEAEAGYAIYCKRSTDLDFQICGVVNASVTSFSTGFVDVAGDCPLEPNTAYQFEVRAFAGITHDLAAGDPGLVQTMAVRSLASTGSAVTRDGVNADLSPPMWVGQAFSHTFTVTQGQAAISSSRLLGQLPPGISYEPATRTLSGTPAAVGPYTPVLMVSWADGWTSTRTLHLRPQVRPGPPIIQTPIADHALSLGDGPLSIPLEFTFADPDSESAVALHVTGADGAPAGRQITIILHESATPLNVANFRTYLRNGVDGYKGSVFHRLEHGFVLQGGAFRMHPGSAPGPEGLTDLSRLSPVENEPGLPNLAGTVAMARMSRDPHSATSDFFFNLADNSSSLDWQNEGFTVFGRVARSSIGALMELASLPHSAAEDDKAMAASYPSMPVIPSQDAAVQPGEPRLVSIDAISAEVPVLGGHRVTSSDPEVVSTSLTGTDLSLAPVAPGTSTISLQVTDLDGNQLQTPLTFQVTVNNTLSNWASTEGLASGQDGPDADPDLDGRKNLLEYALMSSPGTANGSAEPALNTITDGADKKATITFKVRKFASLTYTVEGSSNLSSWTPVWSSSDGFAVPAVSAAVNNADHTLVTIEDSVPFSEGTPRFLRLKVTSP
ncbi:MAG: peptidylprolyl isomerase [Prosthecobacter sp.]